MKDWEMFNRALLGKWKWKLMSGCNDLGSRVLRARYGGRVEVGMLSVAMRD